MKITYNNNICITDILLLLWTCMLVNKNSKHTYLHTAAGVRWFSIVKMVG